MVENKIQNTLKNLQEAGTLPVFNLPEILVERPKDDQFGEYTSNVALVLAKQAGKNSREVAELICEQLTKNGKQEDKFFEKIEVAGPGHLNFYLSLSSFGKMLDEVIEKKNEYGNSQFGAGKKVLLEFVSANPTGPIHLGNARGGPLGDSLSRVMKKAGYQVTNEYYVNDYGNQVAVLGHSLLRDEGAQYKGEYIEALAQEFESQKEKTDDPLEVGFWAAVKIIEEYIKPACAKAGIHFDNWFSEKSLHESGAVQNVLQMLAEKNLTYENEGALWFRSTQFGDDKDRVLVKKDGKTVTYTATDLAYHKNKIERGFDKLINIQGADHHGQAAVVRRFVEEILGAKDTVDLIMTQMVRVIKDGQEVKMSKRRGTYYALDDLIGEVGKDPVRFIFASYAPTSHITFDINLALEQSAKNPVYYVQYAHARLASILRKASEEGFSFDTADLSLLAHPKERELMRELLFFPELIEAIATDYSVHRLPQYAIRLADKLHSFYDACRVLDAEKKDLTAARLELIVAVKIVLGETLRLMGIAAPEKM